MKVIYSFARTLPLIFILVSAKVKDELKDIKKDLGRIIQRLNNIETCLSCASYKPTSSQPEMAILVSGGHPYSKSVEALMSDGKSLCEIEDLPVGRADHTMDLDIICGGENTLRNCTKFEDGKWKAYSSTLNKNRVGHVSWKRPGQENEIQLLGGTLENWQHDYTEIVSSENSVLSYHINYGAVQYLGFSCSIQFNDYFLTTGGLINGYAASWVFQYNSNGNVGRLPNLNNPRFSHGCGSFFNDEGKLVYLVAGGKNGGGDQMIGFENSTEMIVEGEKSWTVVADLPTPRAGLRGASVDNNVFMIGGYWGNDGGANEEDKTFNDILIYNKGLKSWTKTDELLKPRFAHAVSVLPLNEIQQYCKA